MPELSNCSNVTPQEAVKVSQSIRFINHPANKGNLALLPFIKKGEKEQESSSGLPSRSVFSSSALF